MSIRAYSVILAIINQLRVCVAKMAARYYYGDITYRKRVRMMQKDGLVCGCFLLLILPRFEAKE